MMLVRTIILKLILTIYSASSLDVITILISRSDGYGMPEYFNNWLTLNQPFIFRIQSDTELENTIGCLRKGLRKEIKYKIRKNTNGAYVSDNIIANKTMNGQWTCKAGYSGGRMQEFSIHIDIDVDECNEGPWPCSSNADCTNTRGSYNCTCFSGYKGNGTYCQVVNGCQSNPCSHQEECHIEGAGYRCSAVNPCKNNPCHENAICVDLRPGFKCDCRTGFTGNGSSCSALDPCQSNPCPEMARCIRVDLHPGYKCECNQGSCKAVNPCKNNPCHENAICVDLRPGFKCDCRTGFTGNGSSCSALDPCQSNPCPEMARCIRVDQHPGYKCECNQGSCKDADECQYTPCHARAVCVNTYPGFKCFCREGFSGDGYSSCSDIDECKNSQACNGIKNSYCKNTDGGFRCECQRGYYQNAKGLCEDIDECHQNISYCNKGDVCLNTPGSYTCRPNDAVQNKSRHGDCPESHIYYVDKGFVYNQCLHIKCGLGAECKMLSAKPQCYCPNGTTGNPYAECATTAEAGPPPNRYTRKSENLEPYIDITLYGSITDKSLKHYTTGYDRIICDKKFTISVVRKDKEFKNTESWITCFKKEHPIIIHVNQTLVRAADSKYIAEVPKAHQSMNGNWKCYIKTSSQADVRLRSWNKSSIIVEFPVTIIKEPVIMQSIKSAFGDNEIYIEFDKGNGMVRNATLWLNRPFSIVIKSISSGVTNITNIKCHFAENNNQIFTNNEKLVWDQQNYVYRAQEGKAVNMMSSSWKCHIIYYNSYSKKKQCDLKFKVTVKNPEFVKHGYIYVNDVSVNTTHKNAAKGTYEFFMGEIVKVSCKKDKAAFMNMSYFDGNSLDIVTKMSYITTQTMYLKIVRVNTYVQCNVILSSNMDDVQSIRLDFIKRRGRSDLPSFNVNGLALVPREATSHYTLFYEYFEGEFINFTVSNGQRWKKVDGSKKTKLQGGNFTYSNYAKKKTTTFASEDDPKSIIFYLRPVPKYLNAIISGLPFSQTNIKYLYNSSTYRTEIFNKNNEILNLTCSSPAYENCEWDQNTMSNDSLNTFINNVTFFPQKHSSGRNVLKCICGNNIHEVTILRDDIIKTSYKEPQGKEAYDASDSNPDTEKPLGGSLSDNSDSNNSDGTNNRLILGVIIVVALVVVAAVVWLMVGLYKRRQRREKAIQSEFNYESLENTSERTMPPPAQWDNYSLPVDREIENDTETYTVPYTERNVEEMYAKPQPKTLRKPPNESLYTEPSYATVEQPDERPTYGNLSHQTAGYSQIKPNKLIGNANTPKVLPTEAPYAEVLPKSMRPNKESSKYANVFDNQRYVNSDNGESSRDRSEYAEPAYCEIGYKK